MFASFYAQAYDSESKLKNHTLFRVYRVKVSVKENEVPTEKILVARVFSLQRQVIYQIEA